METLQPTPDATTFPAAFFDAGAEWKGYEPLPAKVPPPARVSARRSRPRARAHSFRPSRRRTSSRAGPDDDSGEPEPHPFGGAA